MIENHTIDQDLDQDDIQDQGMVVAERTVIDLVQGPGIVNALRVITPEQEIGKSVENQEAVKEKAKEVVVEVEKGVLKKQRGKGKSMLYFRTTGDPPPTLCAF